MKRLLSPEEKEDILGVIQSFRSSSEVDQHILNVRASLAKQLDTLVMYPECIPKFKEEVKLQYYRSQLAPGEMVGVIAASSIGEQNTQASLNSFHSSGAFKANLTSGLTRLNELMNATENIKTPSLTVYFNKSVPQDLQTIRKICFSKLIWVELEDLTSSVKVQKASEIREVEPFYALFDQVLGVPRSLCSHRVRIQLNPLKLWRHQITMKKIVKKICDTNDFTESFKVHFVYSHESQGILDAWVCLTTADLEQNLCHKDGTLATKLSLSGDFKFEQYVNRVFLPNVLSVNLSGIPGLKDCYYTEYKKEWRVDTKGGKLKELLKLDCVDGTRCRSNDMHEIFQLFGVEACKQMLRDEYGMLVGKVNPRHLELLIDSMTSTGSIQRVTRFGIDRKQVGTIAKASFEMPVDNFLISATFAENDPLKGVSAAITVGKVAKIGTGFFDLMCNTKMLSEIPEEVGSHDAEDVEMVIEEEEEEEPVVLDVKMKDDFDNDW